MVTGDNIFTAKAIAQECGILDDKGLVVEGKDFRTWDAVQLDRDLKHLSVMARSSPTDKLKLVQALQARRNVVAVTGDGTNDAPALHAVLICLLLVVRVHVDVTFEMLQFNLMLLLSLNCRFRDFTWVKDHQVGLTRCKLWCCRQILGCPWELQAQMLPKRVLISSFWMITSPQL
jgi:hypothetical protein